MNDQLGQIAMVMTAIRVAYKVLASRVLALLGLVMTFGLYSWAMVKGTVLHFAIAGTFGACIFLPLLLKAKAEQGDSDG